MQSRLRKEGSIPEPTLTDSSLAKPGKVLQVIINWPTIYFTHPQQAQTPGATRTRGASTGHV